MTSLLKESDGPWYGTLMSRGYEKAIIQDLKLGPIVMKPTGPSGAGENKE